MEGRSLAKGEVGIASIDLKQPVLMLSQFLDNSSYMKVKTGLNTLQPVEVSSIYARGPWLHALATLYMSKWTLDSIL